MENPITSRDLHEMAGHWLGCPVNGYLGSDYGSEFKSLLQTPMASGLAEDLIAKMRDDIPLLSRAAPGSVNLYAYDRDFETKVVALEIGGQLVELGVAS